MKKLLLIGMGALLLTGCTMDGRNPRVGVGVSVGNPAPEPVIVATPKGGPPSWAPAHGRRAKEVRYRYQYYPASGVYVNVSTGSYFYMNGRGGSGNSDSVISGSLASAKPPRGGDTKERGNEEDETEPRSDL
ncbi:MAG: hypothetical protein HRU82_01545 [Nitrospira sp.]|nr:MAG: hypothetical protein HRU82_01545 [Nitrospira sp.]